MKKLKLMLIPVLLCVVVNAFPQSNSDFIVIDEGVDGIDQLKSEFNDQSNVLVTKGFSPNALKQLTDLFIDLQINDLHVYVSTKPGAIVFNSIALTPDNVDEWSLFLKKWGTTVNGKIVIHSEDVFSGEQGLLLKQSLENISGLVFINQY